MFCHTALMAAGTRIRCCCLTAGRVSALLLLGICFGVVGRGVAKAQDEPRVVDGGVPTLHVYTNLIQIPTLVLGPSLESIKKPIAENRFSVSIDDGPWFPAIHVRPEGDDPIALSILLDVNGDTSRADAEDWRGFGGACRFVAAFARPDFVVCDGLLA